MANRLLLDLFCCPLWSAHLRFWLKKTINQQMQVLTTWCHYTDKCKLNTSHSCGARRPMVLIWWGRTVYTFPITTYGEFSKGSTSVNTVCSTSSQWNKQNPQILAGTSYFMRWRARLLSHATSEFFCLAVNPVVSEPASSRDCNSNVPLRLWRMIWEFGAGKPRWSSSLR